MPARLLIVILTVLAVSACGDDAGDAGPQPETTPPPADGGLGGGPYPVADQIYGGADVADISGTIDDQSVDARVSREDGCAIDDWDNLLVDLLPAPLGATSGPTSPEGDS